jgi:hypothetical protein
MRLLMLVLFALAVSAGCANMSPIEQRMVSGAAIGGTVGGPVGAAIGVGVGAVVSKSSD